MIIYTPNTAHEDTVEKILDEAKSTEDRAKFRTLWRYDAEKLLSTIDANPDCQTARRYSAQGFVPNSYKWPAKITRATATRSEDGTYSIFVERVDAKRSHGEGALTVVNGRAA